jgi:hypothetical protein
MRLYSINVATGQAFDLAAYGDYVLVRSSAVDLIIENTESGEKIEVSQGDDFQFEKFNNLRISHSSGADQQIKLIISTGKRAGSAKVGGSVTVSGAIDLGAPVNATGSNAQKTVTNASASMVAANATRKYLLIQNKDAAGDIYINFGAAATMDNGLKIAAGGSFELNSNILTAQIFAIGSIASNANIVVVEG